MAGVNGTVTWGITPISTSGAMVDAFYEVRGNWLKGVHEPMRYQVQWQKSGLTEAVEPSKLNYSGGNGDLVNVIFNVRMTSQSHSQAGITWEDIGSIKKSRDIANKKYDNLTPAEGHRFTVDISSLVADHLSYSLCPLNKGTWQNNRYGGMNGGELIQDNVLGNNGATATGYPVSNYNVSWNGSYRNVQVYVDFQIINADGEIEDASGTSLPYTFVTTAINAVNQFNRDSVYLGNYIMSNVATASTREAYKFLTRCTNFAADTSLPYKKPVRIDEQGEFLQFYLYYGSSIDISGSGDNVVASIGMKIETFEADGSAENTFYIRDFEDNAIIQQDTVDTSFTVISNGQFMNFVQNISPYYINNTAALKNASNAGATSFPYWTTYSGNKITDSTSYYRVSIVKRGLHGPYTERRYSQYRYYTIDREDEKIPYAFVRFHWLNSLGGIDSYTAKRNITEGFSISKDIIERKSSDRTWIQQDTDGGSALNNSDYISDTMRGGDTYKGGREVSNVNAEENRSVYTEPLNIVDAEWLKEIFLSPNVWIETDTDAGAFNNDRNPYLRPSSKEYTPVIITNSDIETVNQEEGLVKFNIEYTFAHKVITQRN